MVPEAGISSPLTPADAALLDGARLPPLARHRLRLLGHSLRTLQAIAGRHEGAAPAAETIVAWAKQQDLLAADPGFRAAFCQQLQRSALLLAEIAGEVGRASRDPGSGASSPRAAIEPPANGPLGLELRQLIAWFEQGHDDPDAQAP